MSMWSQIAFAFAGEAAFALAAAGFFDTGGIAVALADASFATGFFNTPCGAFKVE